jgi:hypothetical protein
VDTLILKSKSFLFWFEWTCTIILLAGVVLTSLNIFPLNIWFLLLGNVGWIVLGIIWRKVSLIVLQTVITIIYIAGLMNTYI